MFFDKRMKHFLKVVGIAIGGFYLISGIIMWRYYHTQQEPILEFRGWIFYWDGPYKGKVIDADTGGPIEGAVVAGSWTVTLSPGYPYFCDARETITDKNGEFILPRGHCFHPWPLAELDPPSFVVFRPGYFAYPPDAYPEIGIQIPNFTGNEFRDKKKYNLMILGKPRTKEERINVLHTAENILNDFDGYKRLPMLLDLADKENKALGFGERPNRSRGRK